MSDKPNRLRISPETTKSPPNVDGNPVRNELLLALPSRECESILPQLTFIQLRARDVLHESEEPIKFAYFVDSGLMSILSVMDDGKSVEVGLAGREGFIGLPLLVGFRTSPTRAVVQIDGAGFRISAEELTEILRRCPVLEKKLQQYGQIFTIQATQVAACNRLHEVDERLARWLLMSQDRIGSDIIPLTHEFLAHMLGTRRSSVTVAAGLLSRAGLITYNRGHVKIENRDRLEDAACECYEQIQRYTDNWKKETR